MPTSSVIGNLTLVFLNWVHVGCELLRGLEKQLTVIVVLIGWSIYGQLQLLLHLSVDLVSSDIMFANFIKILYLLAIYTNRLVIEVDH